MKNSLYITLFVFVLGSAFYVFVTQTRSGEESATACTAEALMCPDGSSVGRGGPACAFAACAPQSEFVGVLERQGEEYRLRMAAPEGSSSQEVSYSLPLIVTAGTFESSLIGKRVSLGGSFTEGNTLAVENITALTGAAADSTQVTLVIGASGYANGVKITVHKITSDSRCPSDVQCIWAGSLTAEVTLQSDTDKEDITITSESDPIPFDAYQVRIVDVAPIPLSKKQIESGEYRLTFSVVSNR